MSHVDTIERHSPKLQGIIDNHVILEMIERHIEQLSRHPNDFKIQTEIESELAKYYIIQASPPAVNAGIWLVDQYAFVREIHQRPITTRIIHALKHGGVMSSKRFYKDKLRGQTLSEIPIRVNITDTAKIDLKHNNTNKLALTLLHMYKEMTPMVGKTVTSLGIYNKTDAICNMNDFNGWLRDEDSQSTSQMHNSLSVVSLKDVFTESILIE